MQDLIHEVSSAQQVIDLNRASPVRKGGITMAKKAARKSAAKKKVKKAKKKKR